MGIFSLSGYQTASIGGSATLLFLIPLLAIVVLVNDVQGFLDDNKTKYLTYVTAGIPLIYIISRIFDLGGDFFEITSIGTYLTLAASIDLDIKDYSLEKFVKGLLPPKSITIKREMFE